MLHVAMNVAFDSPKPVDYLSSLNERQRLAVEHGSGKVARPLLIIAGAGSGKTNTLAHRVVHLIVNGADPRRILLMTFSRRAAVEMTKRVERIASRVLGDRASVMTDGLTWGRPGRTGPLRSLTFPAC
jgi:DNA helicase-2/ATP-dependent DNA helicase PcrA